MAKEALIIKKNHMNLDYGMTTPHILHYLSVPKETEYTEKTLSFDLDLPLIYPENTTQKENININCQIYKMPENKNWILTVNGFASSVKLWEFQKAEFLRKGYNLVLFDLLGQGQSSKPANTKYTMDVNVQCMEKIVSETPLKDSPFILMGVSAGGMVAQHYANKHQEQLKTLVLLATASKASGLLDFSMEFNKKLLNSITINDEDKKMILSHSTMINIFSDIFFRQYKIAVDQLVYEFCQRNSVSTILGANYTIENFDSTPYLPQIKIPTLIFSALHDKLIETHHSLQLNQLLPNSKRFIFRGVHASHTFLMEMFETFNEICINELDQINSSFEGTKTPIYIDNDFIQDTSQENIQIHL